MRQFYERFRKPILLRRDAKSSSKEQEAVMRGEGMGTVWRDGREVGTPVTYLKVDGANI